MIGMFFSNLVMYFIILATASTLFKAGQHDISSAAEAAEALRMILSERCGRQLRVKCDVACTAPACPLCPEDPTCLACPT